MIYSPRSETRYQDSAGNGIACPDVQIVGTTQRDVRAGENSEEVTSPSLLISSDFAPHSLDRLQ